jgi:dUTP pyrophosphatase
MKVVLKSGRLRRSTEDAAGFDLFSMHPDFFLVPGEQQLIGTGVYTQMEGCFGLIRDRSGLAAKFQVTTRGGVIDCRYAEEWKVILVNEGREPFLVKTGDRIAQVLFLPQPPNNVVEVEPGSNAEVTYVVSARDGGFGSTGR